MSALKKVLVVDDDPVIGKSFDRVLSRKGYMVINAENGQDALNKLATETYDAVFTDIRMPGMSGLEVAERMRANRPWTPVVIITGHGTDEAEARAKAAGVREFLRKPLSPEMIESSAAAAVAAPAKLGATVAAATSAPTVEARAPDSGDSTWKSIAAIFAVPFVGLAFVVLFPFIGFAALAWTGFEAWQRRHAAVIAAGRKPNAALLFVRNLVLFFASPFIALAYIALFPFVGMAMLVRTAAVAYRQRHGTA